MPDMDTLTTWLKAERGRQKALAAALGINQAAISQWTRVPADRLIAVERATGISRDRLRPDLFAPQTGAAE